MGHTTCARFHFHNSLDVDVELVSEDTGYNYTPQGFKPFDDQVVPPGGCFCFEERLTDYESVDSPEEAETMLKIAVNVGEETVGWIYFIREISPDVSVCFSSNDDSCFELRYVGIQRKRGCYVPQSRIEVVPKNFQ